MRNQLIRYWKDETAAEAIQVILIAILGVALVTGVGFFLWSLTQRQSQQLQAVEDQMDTPTDDPFAEGTNPFR